MNEEQKKKLAELDALAREQDERAARREAEHAARIAGLRAADRIHRLAKRLEALELLDLEDNLDEAIEFGFVAHGAEVIPAIGLDDLMYSEINGEIIVQRETAGRIRWTRVGDDGEPVEPWNDAAPPSQTASQN